MEKPRPLVLWLLDTLAGTLYTWLYYVVGWGPRGWFLHLGLPLILGLSVISLFMISWLGRKRRDWPHVSIAVLAEITLYAVYADVLFSLYQHTGRPLQYSLVIAVCCLALMAFFIAVARNKRLRAWLSRKFFIDGSNKNKDGFAHESKNNSGPCGIDGRCGRSCRRRVFET